MFNGGYREGESDAQSPNNIDTDIANFDNATNYFTQIFNTTSIDFDAKKVAEEIFLKIFDIDFIDRSECKQAVKVILKCFSPHYTPSQRDAIINELNKL